MVTLTATPSSGRNHDNKATSSINQDNKATTIKTIKCNNQPVVLAMAMIATLKAMPRDGNSLGQH